MKSVPAPGPRARQEPSPRRKPHPRPGPSREHHANIQPRTHSQATAARTLHPVAPSPGFHTAPTRLHLRLLLPSLLFGWLPPFVAPRVRTLALRAAGLQIGRSSFFWSLPTLVGAAPSRGTSGSGGSAASSRLLVRSRYPDSHRGHVSWLQDVSFITSVRETGPPPSGRAVPPPRPSSSATASGSARAPLCCPAHSSARDQ